MVYLILRKKTDLFFSIEKVFKIMTPFLKATEMILPYESKGTWARVLNLISLFSFRRDVIHVTGHDHYLLAIKFFKKSILTVHDIEILKRTKGVKRYIIKKVWFDLPIKNATVVTAISEFTANEIRETLKTSKSVLVINNPITVRLKYLPKDNFQSLNPRILQIGTKANKNIDRLIEAIDEIPCTLVIVGQISNTTLKKIEKAKFGFENFTKLSEEELENEYKKSDIVSLISTYEGFGLPIVEAQSIGRVVITSNCGAMRETAGNGALLVDPFSVDSIRSGFEKLINNESLRRRLIHNGRENSLRFTPRAIASQYKEVYEELG